MIRRLAVFELWLLTLIFAVAVGYGLSDRWGRATALFIGIPILVWSFLTWRKLQCDSDTDLDFILTLRVFTVCLISSFLMFGLEREFFRYLRQPWIAVISIFWMLPPLILFLRRMLDVRKDLYQK